jgi:3'-phosphoadenosine 5'-phosphosulfate sulfotransferase (PAPS reductase)/FAD synthetase
MTKNRILSNCLRRTLTIDWHRRVEIACRDIDRWLEKCRAPIVSCSGGKDSTVLLALCRERRPDIPVIRADPPNPLPERAEHVHHLQDAAAGEWHVVPYPWDVEAVLEGRARYPANLKIRQLQSAQKSLNVDGVALGIRAAESAQRRRILRARGTVYQLKDGSWRCCPLAWWSAEDVLGYLLRLNSLPLNPVYRHTERMPEGNLEWLRDGTWWPHGLYPEQNRPWMELHYPDVVGLFDRALRIGASSFVDQD